MSAITTKAIVFTAIKYSDTSLIVRCFTQEEGLKSYLLKGVLKSKKSKLKPAYFQPLTQLTMVANHRSKSTLHSIKEVHVEHPYKSIHQSIIKQTIVLFLAEVLSETIQEEEANQGLYSYIETALIWLDIHDDIANFHLLFLLNLTRFLGFYPDLKDQEKQIFHMREGRFISGPVDKECLTGQNLFLFKRLLGIHFDTMHTVPFIKKERQEVLHLIIRYFDLHLDGFKPPKSLGILETVFS